MFIIRNNIKMMMMILIFPRAMSIEVVVAGYRKVVVRCSEVNMILLSSTSSAHVVRGGAARFL